MIRFFCSGDPEYSDLNLDSFVELSDQDATYLLGWLGYRNLPSLYWGVLDSSDLKARCRRRLWPIARNNASVRGAVGSLLRVAERDDSLVVFT